MDFIGPANSQMELLKNQMSFQNLSQGVRRIWLHNDVYVECIKCFNYQECKIWVRPRPRPEERKWEKEESVVVVISSESGSEAVAWDLLTDSLVASGSLSDVQSAIIGSPTEATPTTTTTINTGAGGNGSSTSLGYGLPDAYPNVMFSLIAKTVGLVPDIDGFWRTLYPTNPDNGCSYFELNLACLGGDSYEELAGWDEGDSVVFTTTAGSDSITINSVNTTDGPFDSTKITGDADGAINETWTIWVFTDSFGNYFFTIEGASVGTLKDHLSPDALSSFPYPRDGWDYEHDYIEMDDFEGEICTAYFWHWYGYALGSFNGTDVAKDEFEAITGTTWPSGEDYVLLDYMFINPVFGADLSSGSAYLSQLIAGTDELYNSWEDADWSGGVQISEMGAWIMRGIAQQAHADLICDAYTICTDIGAGDTCNDYSARFNSGMHIFFRQPAACALSTNRITVHDAINAERVAVGLNVLFVCPNLQAAAQRHADDMAANRFIGHEGSDGTSPHDRIIAADYLLHTNRMYQAAAAAENCAAGDLSQTEGECRVVVDGDVVYEEDGGCSYETLVNGWMNSSGHRANILYADFTDTGIGVAVDENGVTYVCQTFGFRQNKWPGFGPFNTQNLKAWIDTNFLWTAEGDETRLPKIYLA